MVDGRLEAVHTAGGTDAVGELLHAELLRELVEHAELAAVGRVERGELYAPHGVTDVQEASSLAALPVNSERMADGGLGAEPVQDGAPDVVVVEALAQLRMQVRLIRAGAVDDALVEVGRPQPPRAAREHDVVAVVDLGQVIEGTRLLRIREPVLAAVVLDFDETLFDVDVGSAVFA